MRTGKITIGGKDYITCLSTRVLVALEERGGDADQELARIMQGRKLGDLFWLLAQMIDAGDRYAKLEGLDNPGSLTLDAIMDCMGPDDYEAMTGAMGGDRQGGDHAHGGGQARQGQPKKRRGQTGGRVTPAWYLWYGLQVGLTRLEALDLPLSVLLDLVAVHQIKTEGAEHKPTKEDEAQAFMRLLTFR